MLGGLVKKVASATMGSCGSKPNKKSNIHRRENKKSAKRKGNISTSHADMPLKRRSNAGSRVSDYPLTDFVHQDFEKGALKSDVSNKKFHLAQLYHSHSQNASGTFSPSLPPKQLRDKRLVLSNLYPFLWCFGYL